MEIRCEICKQANHVLLHDWIVAHPFTRPPNESFQRKHYDIMQKISNEDDGWNEIVASAIGVYSSASTLCDFCGEERFGVFPTKVHLSEHLLAWCHFDCAPCTICNKSLPGVPTSLFQSSQQDTYGSQICIFCHGKCFVDRLTQYPDKPSTFDQLLTLLDYKREGNHKLCNLAREAFNLSTNGTQEDEEDALQPKEDLSKMFQTALQATRFILNQKLQAMMHSKDADPFRAGIIFAPYLIPCSFCKEVRAGQEVYKYQFYGIAVAAHYDCIPCSICGVAIAGSHVQKTAYGQAHANCAQTCSTDMLQDEVYCEEANCWQRTPCLVHDTTQSNEIACSVM
jgi:hypothetical protein